MKDPFRVLTLCSIAVIVALLVVGAVSHGILRHIVQTAPLWIAIVLGGRRSSSSKWTALPCFLFWLLVMTAIWLFLVGWARIITGTFSPTEIAMTLIVGLASLVGMVKALSMKTDAAAWQAALIFVTVAVLQIAALRISLLPAIAHR
jgi:hypothetical protein